MDTPDRLDLKALKESKVFLEPTVPRATPAIMASMGRTVLTERLDLKDRLDRRVPLALLGLKGLSATLVHRVLWEPQALPDHLALKGHKAYRALTA